MDTYGNRASRPQGTWQFSRKAGSTLQRVEDEAHELVELEVEGDSGATPLIAIAGVWIFLVPIFLLMLGCALAAYYLA